MLNAEQDAKIRIITDIFTLKKEIEDERRIYLFDYLYDQPLEVLKLTLKSLEETYEQSK